MAAQALGLFLLILASPAHRDAPGWAPARAEVGTVPVVPASQPAIPRAATVRKKLADGDREPIAFASDARDTDYPDDSGCKRLLLVAGWDVYAVLPTCLSDRSPPSSGAPATAGPPRFLSLCRLLC